jgi:hypothetical protein
MLFVWGLKRSGNHLLANWLYANAGGEVKRDLDTDGLHPLLFQGFCDPDAGVAFFNNCGFLNSRNFGIGELTTADFALAASRQSLTIFGIEDCRLEFASRVPSGPDVVDLVLLRDPLNNIASRLEGAKAKREVFRTDEAYVDLYAEYCAEALGESRVFERKVVVNFNRFVEERSYRDSIAASLGLANLDLVDEATDFGGSSSFSPGTGASSTEALMTRFREHPVPAQLLDLLSARQVIRDACIELFGYDLTTRLGAL